MADALTLTRPPAPRVARKMLIAFLNVAATPDTPEWAPIGKRVEDSSQEYDWGEETKTDILGETSPPRTKPLLSRRPLTRASWMPPIRPR